MKKPDIKFTNPIVVGQVLRLHDDAGHVNPNLTPTIHKQSKNPHGADRKWMIKWVSNDREREWFNEWEEDSIRRYMSIVQNPVELDEDLFIL